MILTVDEYFNLVSDLISRTEFEDRISKYSEKCSGLITDEVLAHLIVDELGRNVYNFINISELRPGKKASLFAKVTSPEPKLFFKKTGELTGAEVFISDYSGRIRLVLWDPDHIELIQQKRIKIDTKLKVLNAKVTKSSYGLALTVDRFESLILDPADFPEEGGDEVELLITDIAEVKEDGPINILGTIAWKSQLRTFNRKEKNTGYVINLELYDGTGKIRITLWDQFAKTAEDYNVGEQLKIINGVSKLHDSEREVHSSYRTQVILIKNGDN